MKKLLTLALMSVLSFGVMADDWKKLGERRVSFQSEQDVIHVSGFKGRYDTIAFRVGRAPIFMKKIRVVFGNGESQNIFINRRLEKGKRSLPYRLLEGDRVINKIELDYRTAVGGHKYAEVSVYGKRS
ncbi:hypothetical protein [Endozoicomonas sp. GU-1]|uniref:DUF2541 family protein n=1 Tax=Endozoicomonas sp. GU-1 TaxID=3009078 RepID=UPI0022B48B2E|nr:hypothetical protein [Endozoicomonas sp. GU-1]WBA82020.1 hypothetical protein O2T12_02300 [Endozoicomonas sp. GU-1]WBA84966.1 hypothetical protein O3276_17055 [Endozoicomonas sp. GU-1]